ncbi:hypothetical protein CAS92_00630 [Acinetobacter baumannii]|nr:hypothetical protein B9X38_14780 [Acinetobacter baumannii]OTS90646.1 hypothetical protein CAS92_00630 [Acinetobacter baumannii]OVL16881.1 hypothetical protein B4R74_16330 [Acinetobacter baumannii]
MMKDEKFLNDLIQKIQQGHQFKYLYFWGHTPKKANLIDKSCFSQWFPAQFNVEGIEYLANSNMRCDSFKSHMIINKLSKFL